MPSAELSKCCTRAAFQLFSLCPVWGPTQGFVLGPICPLVCGSNRPNRCSARAQVPQYADGCQIYVATSVRAVHSAIDQLSGCLHDVDVWMSASRLRLNASKTQVLWLGSRYNIDRLTVQEVPVLSSTVGVVANMVDRTTIFGRRLTTRPINRPPSVNGRPRSVSLSLSILSPPTYQTHAAVFVP